MAAHRSRCQPYLPTAAGQRACDATTDRAWLIFQLIDQGLVNESGLAGPAQTGHTRRAPLATQTRSLLLSPSLQPLHLF